jgi:hypothetical protein
MPIFLLLFVAVGCTDYVVSPIKEQRRSNWFDSQSDEFRSGLDPDESDTADPYDTGAWFDDGEDVAPDDGDEDVPSGDDPSERDSGSPGSSDGSSSGSSDGSSSGSSSGSSGDSSSGSSDDSSPEDSIWVRTPWAGEMVITELMIHPDVTDDSVGEWVELRNTSDAWLTIEGHRLADRGVDDVEIEAVTDDSLVVGPGEYLIICAESDYWDNGGVYCDGTFHYWTLGGGFALSNTEDEVKLLTASGSLLDEVRYGAGFSIEGEAMGLKPELASAAANDHPGNWCEQGSFMPFGDAGTPGAQNDTCW